MHPSPDQAADAYEAALRINPKHMGAYVNGVHCLQMLPPDDSSARARLKRLAQMGVTAGVWQVWL